MGMILRSRRDGSGHMLLSNGYGVGGSVRSAAFGRSLMRLSTSGGVAPTIPLTTLSDARTVLFGDSLTDPLYNIPQPFIIGNGYINAPFRVIANLGVSGETIESMLARVNNAYTASSPGLAGIGALTAVVLRCGTNNARGGNNITSGTQAAFASLVTALRSYAPIVIVQDVPPIGSPDNGSGVNSFNTYFNSYCAGKSGVWRLNDTTTVNNGSGAWVSGLNPGDGIHYGAAQAGAMGIAQKSQLTALASAYTVASPLSKAAGDLYPATQQYVVGYLNAGSGSTNGVGSGQMPSGWSLGAYGSGYAAVTRIDPASSGDPNQTPWLVVTPTSLGTPLGYLQLAATLSTPAITTSFPNQLEVEMEIRFAGWAGDRIADFKALVYGNANENLTSAQVGKIGQVPSMNEQFIVRGAIPRPTSGRVAHSTINLLVQIQPGTAYTGSIGEFAIRNATVRALS